MNEGTVIAGKNGILDDSEDKRIVSIFASTAFEFEECYDEIEKCLKTLQLPSNFVIVLSAAKKKIRIVGSKYTTHLLVVGECSNKGWEASRMREICQCLEDSGYLVQALLSPHSFVPL